VKESEERFFSVAIHLARVAFALLLNGFKMFTQLDNEQLKGEDPSFWRPTSHELKTRFESFETGKGQRREPRASEEAPTENDSRQIDSPITRLG
jgi:hypothetical protein